jgi:hypothetical protein
MAFANEMMAWLEQHDQDIADGLEPGPIEWDAVRSALLATLPEIGWASLREWLVEGIRITYARHVHATYNRRSAWKFLKGPPVQLSYCVSCAHVISNVFRLKCRVSELLSLDRYGRRVYFSLEWCVCGVHRYQCEQRPWRPCIVEAVPRGVVLSRLFCS